MQRIILYSLMALGVLLIINHKPSRKQLRSYLSDKVYYITNEIGNSGGTGFALQNDKGEEYIVTNNHVCSHVQKNGLVKVRDGNGILMDRKVIAISDKSDLCVVEPIPNMPSLRMGSSIEIGDNINILGHPHLNPNTMTSGEVSFENYISLIDFLMTVENKNECKGPARSIQNVNMFFFTVKACVVTYWATYTTANIFPGNSGSPVVNDWGQVVGVAFAASSDDNWGIAVTLQDLKDFVNNPYGEDNGK